MRRYLIAIPSWLTASGLIAEAIWFGRGDGWHIAVMVCGAIGWLLVGDYQLREHDRKALNP